MVNDLRVANKYVALSSSAAARKKEFSLSFASLKRVMNTKKCYFTGAPIDINADKDSPLRHTIDRLDNRKGYVDGNVVACARYFNKKKGSLTLKEIELLYKGLKRRELL